MKSSSVRWGQLIALAGAVLIASMTLFPHPELAKESSATPLSCLLCGDYGVVDVFLNTLLFIPFGLGLRLMGGSRRQSQVALMVTSLCIELLQLKIVAGRDASLSDFITNSLGGGLGIWIADHWTGFVFPSAALSRMLRIPAALAWVVVWTASAWLVEPSMTRKPWFGQLAAQDVLLDNFRGELLTGTVNGVVLPSARLEGRDSAAIYDRFVAGSVTVGATVIAGPPTSFPAPIVSIFDRAHSEIMVLGQDGEDLIFRLRLRAADYELHEPELRLPGVLSREGDTLRVGGGLHAGQLYLRATSARLDRSRVAALSPSWGWMFVLPWHYAMGPEGRFLTALWVAGLLLPVAFWASRGLRRSPEASGEIGFLILIVGLGLGLVPLVAGLPPVHWSEWLSAGGGLACGWWLGRRSAAFRPATTGVN